MSDLVSRLLAAIEQEEQDAQKAAEKAGPDWAAEPCTDHTCEGHVHSGTRELIACQPCEGGGLYKPVGDHVARHDPSSVLRRCEADRMILQQHRPISDVDWLCGVCIEPGYIGLEYRSDWPTVNAPCPTLVALASAYGLSVEEETTHE